MPRPLGWNFGEIESSLVLQTKRVTDTKMFCVLSIGNWPLIQTHMHDIMQQVAIVD